ncbi:MAG: hypothetical protein LBN39_12265 [Planctomycetaceae bacterium]|jgi:hypothetical protein|nr:hypothetical protein [Planctomycetaceae bacterium]
MRNTLRNQKIQLETGEKHRQRTVKAVAAKAKTEELPEMTEEEIVALCKAVRRRLHLTRPELYAKK